MKDKDYKNEKRNKERKLVEMYEESNKDSGRDSEKAKMYIEILGICLSGITTAQKACGISASLLSL